MVHMINSENGKVYPFPPKEESDDLSSWIAMVTLIDQGRLVYDPETDYLTLLSS